MARHDKHSDEEVEDFGVLDSPVVDTTAINVLGLPTSQVRVSLPRGYEDLDDDDVVDDGPSPLSDGRITLTLPGAAPADGETIEAEPIDEPNEQPADAERDEPADAPAEEAEAPGDSGENEDGDRGERTPDEPAADEPAADASPSDAASEEPVAETTDAETDDAESEAGLEAADEAGAADDSADDAERAATRDGLETDDVESEAGLEAADGAGAADDSADDDVAVHERPAHDIAEAFASDDEDDAVDDAVEFAEAEDEAESEADPVDHGAEADRPLATDAAAPGPSDNDAADAVVSGPSVSDTDASVDDAADEDAARDATSAPDAAEADPDDAIFDRDALALDALDHDPDSADEAPASPAGRAPAPDAARDDPAPHEALGLETASSAPGDDAPTAEPHAEPARAEVAPHDDTAEDPAMPTDHAEPAVPRTRSHRFVTAPKSSSLDSTAGGESANQLTSDRLVEPRRGKPRPEGAWRGFWYSVSGGLINLGDSKAVRERKDLIARIGVPLPGRARFVPVLSRKGGVGKTTVTTLLGMALADARDDRVVAVDANPDRGTLSERIESRTDRTVRDVVRRHDRIRGYADISDLVARDATRLDVVASDTDPHVADAFDDADYRTVADVTSQYYSMVLTDTGTGIIHSVMDATLDLADQIVVVAGASVDESRLASETLTWLEAHGRADLVRGAVVVVNQASPGKSLVRVDEVEAHFASRVRSVVRLPYDESLATGGAIAFGALHPATRQAARRIAAEVIEGMRSAALRPAEDDE